MTQMMKDEFIKGLDTLSWMSDVTKGNAREKARMLVVVRIPVMIESPCIKITFEMTDQVYVIKT